MGETTRDIQKRERKVERAREVRVTERMRKSETGREEDGERDGSTREAGIFIIISHFVLIFPMPFKMCFMRPIYYI